jgi:hypothetical protein
VGGTAAQPKLVVGAVEDAAKWSSEPRAQMKLAHDAGFRAVALSAVWSQDGTPARDLPPLRRAVDAAVAEDVEPVLAVYQLSGNTPDTDASRAAFVAYAVALVRALPDVHTVLVGNEPNLNLYGESAHVPPTLAHPRTTSIGIADYDKLTALLDRFFPRDLPIVYGEYGVETAIPPAKAPAYEGREVVKPVDDRTQARYYDEAARLAACQPRVHMLLFFHVVDEQQLAGLQSGLYYADGTPKSSLPDVRAHLEDPKCG